MGVLLNELSLFTGAGGGILGTHGLLGWKCLGYVEFNDYCQQVIRQRIDDGILDEAPIFGDVRTFVDDGFARSYRGMVDVVSGGFPCQPFSVAGARAGADDSRNMWPATLDVIRAVQPRFAFLENVPGLLSVDDGRYFGRILGDLAESGFNARWRVLSAAECGAPHRRARLWIVGNTTDAGLPKRGCSGRETCAAETGTGLESRVKRSGEVAHTNSGGSRQDISPRELRTGWAKQSSSNPGIADAPENGKGQEVPRWWDTDPADVADTASGESWEQTQREGREDSGGGGEEKRINTDGSTQPVVGRSPYGLA
jgi:DNA (cytosine-5)-methyltransferase 1